MGRILLIVVGVINILVALAFIGCGACANYWDMRSPWHVDVNNKRVADEEMLQAHLKQKVPGYPAVKITSTVLGYVACVGLILASVGLFFGKWWSKFVVAPVFVLALLHHIISIVYQLVWLNPAIETFFAQVPRPAIFNREADALLTVQSYNARLPGYLSITWWVIGCVYYLIATPAVLFIPVASGPPKKDAKVPLKKKPRDEEEEEDEDDDERESRKPKKKR